MSSILDNIYMTVFDDDGYIIEGSEEIMKLVEDDIGFVLPIRLKQHLQNTIDFRRFENRNAVTIWVKDIVRNVVILYVHFNDVESRQ